MEKDKANNGQYDDCLDDVDQYIKDNISQPLKRWITAVPADNPDGVELLLEPNAEYPAMKALKEALTAEKFTLTTTS